MELKNKKNIVIYSYFKKSIYAIIFILFLILLSIFLNGGFTKSYEKKYIISDGYKVVVFQGMTHIGLNSFYRKVGDELNFYRSSGYKVMIEGIGHSGIKPLSKSDNGYNSAVLNYNEFNKKISEKNKERYNDKYVYQSITFNSYLAYDDEYVDLDKNQLYKLIEIDNNSIINNDQTTSTQTAKEQYVKSIGNHSKAMNTLNNNELFYILDRNLRNSAILKKINEIKSYVLSDFITSINLDYNITMKERNNLLSNAIINEINNKIYITYGSAHFMEFLKTLNK